MASRQAGGVTSRHATVADIMSDELTALSAKTWAVAPGTAAPAFDAALVAKIFDEQLNAGVDVDSSRLMLLEFTGFLEKYLWPNYKPTESPFEHLMCIILMVIEKSRQSVPLWKAFTGDALPAFFTDVLSLTGLRTEHRTSLLQFLICAFESLEEAAVRASVLRLASLPLWTAVSPGRVELELRKYPQLRRPWQRLATKPTDALAAGFLPGLIAEFLGEVEGVPATGAVPAATFRFCERFVEFLSDLLSQLPTRRFLRLLVLDHHVLVRCRRSALAARPEATLFRQLVEVLAHYQDFQVDDQTGMAQTEKDVEAAHYLRVQVLQRVVFKQFGDKVREFALSAVGTVGTRAGLESHLAPLSTEELVALAARLRLLPPTRPHVAPDAPPSVARLPPFSREFVMEVLVAAHEPHPSELAKVNAMSLYPTEAWLWDETQLPLGQHAGDGVLALPKLNLQFLTFHDYLLRSFNLYRLEAAYEIREDVVDAVTRLRPRVRTEYNRGVASQVSEFQGWSRMAVPLAESRLDFVSKAPLGSTAPGEVRAQVDYDVGRLAPHLRDEWDSFREHDVVFLLTIKGKPAVEAAADDAAAAAGKAPGRQTPADRRAADERRQAAARDAVVVLRGAEVVQVLDEHGKPFNDPGNHPEERDRRPMGMKRTLRLMLDAAQYQADVDAGNAALYSSFNVILRRNPRENNFKAVLDTIRDVMNVAALGAAVPDWLHDVFLGYGDAAAATYKNLPTALPEVDFCDTFVSGAHARASFPGSAVAFARPDGTPIPSADADALRGPFKARFTDGGDGKEAVTLTPYALPPPGPYPEDVPPRNTVPFTPVQVEAVRSGVNPGLTMVVGPPGTGKTDVAVQIISTLYHAFPTQRTLLVTHSNHALNDLFEKIMQRDIKQRHLLRLGQGERDLHTDEDFSKYGRVAASLERRAALLREVDRLGKSLEVVGDVGYTCETAGYFHLHHVVARTEAFRAAAADAANHTKDFVADSFPFLGFFSTVPGGVGALFKRQDFAADMAAADSCFAHLDELFEDLRSHRAFEVLRTQRQRTDYLLAKQARIVALTCTHAALTRRQLVALQFKYDNIIMEESAQILEVETFIPMLLQNHDEVDGCRLKRVVLIGDHHQLPPVVKNQAFQQYGNLDQSLFARFVRLGTPLIQLNQQGRARPGIASLYNWRYEALGDMPRVTSPGPYAAANAGLAFEYQFVDVGDLAGRGESQPQPFFYQNLAEAEFAVALYQYMRLVGYPASSITILTTYNGQKHLIDDIVEARCANLALYGRPRAVSTVDRYQGQQNDYVILSLVRTNSVGHLRDVRRLVVAMSRARLGLYVFGRRSLFANSYELAPTFNQLLARPSALHLVPNEFHPTPRAAAAPPAGAFEVRDVTHMGVIVAGMAVAAMKGDAGGTKKGAFAPAPPVENIDMGGEEEAGAGAGAAAPVPAPAPAVVAAPAAAAPAPAPAAAAPAPSPAKKRGKKRAAGKEVEEPEPEPKKQASAAPAPRRRGRSRGASVVEEPEPEPKKQARRRGRSRGASVAEASRPKLSMELDLKADKVTITNEGEAEVALEGWKLRSDVGSQHYSFKAGASLAAGASVSVCSGKKAVKKETASRLFWTKQYIWNDEGDTAVLESPEGEEVLRVTEGGAGAGAGVEASPPKLSMELDLKADKVTITNEGEAEVALEGWKLRSDVGSQHYSFKAGASLAVGASVSVCSGKKAVKKETASRLFWTKQYIWNDEGDTAVLESPEGEEVLRVTEVGKPAPSKAAAKGGSKKRGKGGEAPSEEPPARRVRTRK